MSPLILVHDMADEETPANDNTSNSPVTEPLKSDNKTSDVPGPEGRWLRRYGLLLFAANAGCVTWLWMIGVVYTGAVVRTLERRFGLRSTQTGIMISSGDIVHMCIVLLVGYYGRRGHKPRFICITSLFSAVGNFVMVLPHWLFNSQETSLSAFASDCKSCLVYIADTSNYIDYFQLNRINSRGCA